jgi:hypothetical protein
MQVKARLRVVAALTVTVWAAVAGSMVGWPVPVSLAAPIGVQPDVAGMRDEASWIRAAQLPDGAIEVAPGASEISPYGANYAALGLARVASELHDHVYADAAWRWLTWYQAHQDGAGFVTDYRVTGGTETSTQTYDSTDAYAGTFLTAAESAWQADPDRVRLENLAHGITRAVAAIEATQTADGMTWAKPSYRVKLLMDNAEVYGGLRSAVMLATALGEPALASRASTDARRVAAGVASLWNPRSGGFDWAKGANGKSSAPSWTNLYPDAMENVWAIAYGLATPAQIASILAQLKRMQPQWTELGQSSSVDSHGVVSLSVSYWPVAGWALVVAGQRGRALSGAAVVSTVAAARGRAWPFSTGDAGELIALQSGWPATAAWVAPRPPVAGRFPVVGVVVLVAAAAGAVLVSVWVLARGGGCRGRGRAVRGAFPG